MSGRSLPFAGVVLTAALLFSGSAAAQYHVSLPRNDFRWQWGEAATEASRSSYDFEARGGEGGFNCTLSGALRLGTRYSTSDIRHMQSELNISLYFIQAATNTMNQLDFERQLEWAVLDCVRPEVREPDPDAQQERLDRLRERALRRQAERRERAEARRNR